MESHLLIRRAVPVTRDSTVAAGCGPIPAGFPIFVETDGGAIAHEPTVFLASQCLGRGSTEYFIVSPSTAMTRAYRLRDFLDYLKSRRISFENIAANVLFAYAATMANQVSPHTHELYSSNTIARRVSISVQFCVWLCVKGIVSPQAARGLRALSDDLSGWSEMPSSRGVRSRKPIRTTLLPTVARRHQPHILNDEEAKRLLVAIRTGTGRKTELSAAIRHRNTLMTKLALCSGLRREEVCALKIATIHGVNLGINDDLRLFPINLAKTKNEVRRKVLIPGALVREMQSFIVKTRTKLCPLGGKCECAPDEPVFPSSRAPKGSKCVAMSPQSFGLAVYRGATQAGLVHEVARLGADGTVRSTESAPLLSTHDLRHTYAVWTYLLLRKGGDTNPWLFVQAQLGHVSSETTINTYLRAVRMFENDKSEVIVRFVRALVAMTAQDS